MIAGSASKAYAMTGWRCGWTIAPKELTAAFNVIQGQSTSNITSITQKAALAAITGSQDPVTAMLDEYRRRRDNIHAWLTANPGIQCVKPSGAFYLFPDISRLLSADGVATSADFAQALLEKEHVVVTPGEAFDAPGYLRISYATSMEQLREGATRILRFAESLQPAKARACTSRDHDTQRHRSTLRLEIDGLTVNHCSAARACRSRRRWYVLSDESSLTRMRPMLLARDILRIWSSFQPRPRDLRRSRGSVTTSCSARRPRRRHRVSPAEQCRRAAASCCRWRGSTGFSRSTN